MRIGPAAVMVLSCLVIAGCGGYDVSGNEQRILKVLDARYPEARWGVRCHGGGSSDSLPQCYLGFELRKPKPTMLQAFDLAGRVWEFGNSYESVGLDLGFTDPARMDAKGVFRELVVVCPKGVQTNRLGLSFGFIEQGGNIATKAKQFERFHCRLVQGDFVYRTVGR